MKSKWNKCQIENFYLQKLLTWMFLIFLHKETLPDVSWEGFYGVRLGGLDTYSMRYRFPWNVYIILYLKLYKPDRSTHVGLVHRGTFTTPFVFTPSLSSLLFFSKFIPFLSWTGRSKILPPSLCTRSLIPNTGLLPLSEVNSRPFLYRWRHLWTQREIWCVYTTRNNV